MLNTGLSGKEGENYANMMLIFFFFEKERRRDGEKEKQET